MPDLDVTCAKCGNTFVFTEKEQNYYYQRNLIWPRHCKDCRGAKKADDNTSKADNKGRYEITCDQCGKTDTVPFKPAVGRAILCRECYQAMRSRHARGA
jgi:CxxC-x17-CxxC domain-containing protein